MSAAEEYRAAKTEFAHKYVRAITIGGNEPNAKLDAAERRLDDAVRALIAEAVRIGNGYKQGRFVEEGMTTPNALAAELMGLDK